MILCPIKSLVGLHRTCGITHDYAAMPVSLWMDAHSCLCLRLRTVPLCLPCPLLSLGLRFQLFICFTRLLQLNELLQFTVVFGRSGMSYRTHLFHIFAN